MTRLAKYIDFLPQGLSFQWLRNVFLFDPFSTTSELENYKALYQSLGAGMMTRECA